MPDNVYKVGQGVTLEFDLTVAGSPATDTIIVTVVPPSGTPQNPPASENPTGVFKATVTANMAGLWWYSAVTTTNIAVGSGSFVVEDLVPALSARALADILSARQFVLANSADDTQDYRLANLINGYSESIYNYTEREWLPQSTGTRSFSYDGSGVIELAPYEARAVTAVTLYTELPTAQQQVLVAPGPSADGDWHLEPPGATREGTYLRIGITSLVQRPANSPGFPGYGLSQYWQAQQDYKVSVTGSWGIYSSLAQVPYDVRLACLVAVADAYRNPEGFATRSIGPLQLTEETGAAPGGASFGPRELPPEAQGLLEDYRARVINLA